MPGGLSLSGSRRPRRAPSCTLSRKDGIPVRDIAEAIGQAFDLPVRSIAPDDVQDHFGFIGTFFSMDLSATSAATRELLGWTPSGPTLVEDIEAGAYSHVGA